MATDISPWLTDNRSTWESDILAWITDVATTHGLGQIESTTTLKERPWSVVRQVVFEHGTTYFKACSAAGQYEPKLLRFLENQSFVTMPKTIAAELDHKWILTEDAGVQLRRASPELNQLSVLLNALPNYAELQIASTGWVDQLLAIGLPDRRVSHLPALLDESLADDVIGVGHSASEVNELRTSANRLLPEFERACTELGRSPFAAALDHGDFHMANLLVKDESYSLIDWGDACVTHPFSSILVTIEAALKQVPAADHAYWIERMRATYLAPWALHYPSAELSLDFERALWVAHIGRALDFVHMFSGADEETLNQWRPMIFERLKMWVEAWGDFTIDA